MNDLALQCVSGLQNVFESLNSGDWVRNREKKDLNTSEESKFQFNYLTCDRDIYN